jgi:hypothetical protein
MKKIILLLFWSLVGTVTAQVYHEHDKEKFRNYFKQAAALEGIPKGEVLDVMNGIVLEIPSDYLETWETDEEWVREVKGLTWTESIPKRIASVEWSLIRRSFVYNSYALSGSLDLSGCTELTSLFIDQSQLEELDVSGCTSLTSLKCNLNLLTFLNVNGCTALQTLVCAANQLTGLDVSSCTSLITLFCAGNCLTAVDIRNNTKLENLDVDGNLLTTLDVSRNLLLVNVMDMNTPSLTDVIVGWPAPPAIFDGSGVHSFPIRSEGTLYVPVGSVPLYAAAYPWREFGKIVEYTTPSPNSNNAAEQPVRVWSQGNTVFFSTPNQKQTVSVYTLNGSLLRHSTLSTSDSFTLPVGIYFVKVDNFVTKIVIK